jgi:hypothetical protein
MLRSLPARGWSLLCALSWFGLGCSEDKEPAGQLMLAFDSDMAIPKDIDAVELRAAVGPAGLFTVFEVGPGAQRLPATFGIRSKDGNSKVVDVSLSASKQEEVRTLSEAMSSIPTDRIALLRISIQWLCTLRVEKDEEGNAFSQCDDEETCNAGRCDPAREDEDDLPTYDPEDVFGKGGVGDGESGICFDTQSCFGARRGRIVSHEIDLETCRIPIDDEATETNYALRVRGSDGVCIDGGLCLVTLNRNERTGWYEVDEEGTAAEGGGFAQLPEIICEELGPTGRILDVYRAICSPAKVPEVPVCGPWSSAGPPLPEDDPIVLCPEGLSDKPGEDIVADPIVAGLLDLTNELRTSSGELLASLGRACVEMASGLDAEDTWSELGWDADAPTELGVQAACSSAASVVLESLATTLRVQPALARASCAVDADAQAECEEECWPDDACAGAAERCAAENVVSECGGECAGESICQGTVESFTSCNGVCRGICKGECDGGLCTRTDDSTACTGICDGICRGQCGGQCELIENTECGASTTCLGACSDPDAPRTCSTPLAGCDDVDARCGSICATRAALGAECTRGGTFQAFTDWPIEDAELESRLEQVLPQLSILDEVRRQAELIDDALDALDVDAIVDGAAEVGDKEEACAEVVKPAFTATTATFPALANLAGQVLEPVLAFEAAVPIECVVLLNSGDACQECIGTNCCTQYADCVADPRCSAGAAGGEAFCVLGCVLARSETEEVTDEVKQECAAECAAASGETALAPSSVAILECVDANVGGGCEAACYGSTAAEPPPP